jgi:hypothetical protein
MWTLRTRSSSRSRAMPTGQENTDRSGDPVERVPERRARTESAPAVRPRGPEWTTHRWGLQVEAEARRRLKKTIRGIGAER